MQQTSRVSFCRTSRSPQQQTTPLTPGNLGLSRPGTEKAVSLRNQSRTMAASNQFQKSKGNALGCKKIAKAAWVQRMDSGPEVGNPRNRVYDASIPTLPIASESLEHGRRMIYAGYPSFFGLVLEDCHVCNLLASAAYSWGSLFGVPFRDLLIMGSPTTPAPYYPSV